MNVFGTAEWHGSDGDFNLPWRNEPPPPRNKGSIRPYQGLIGYFWGGTSEGVKTPSIRLKGSGRRLRLRGQLRPRAPVVVSPPLAGVRAATSVWVPSWLSLTVASAVVARESLRRFLPCAAAFAGRETEFVEHTFSEEAKQMARRRLARRSRSGASMVRTSTRPTSTLTPSQLPLASPQTLFMFIMTSAMNPASMKPQAKHKEKVHPIPAYDKPLWIPKGK